LQNIILALALTLFAGMATGIGSALAFFAKKTDYRFLSISTGFSAGVMLYVSFVEIFYKGVDSFVAVYGDYWGHWVNAASFFGGILLIAVIDYFIPEAENPHEVRSERTMAPLHGDPDNISAHIQTSPENNGDEFPVPSDLDGPNRSKLLRMGLFTALAIGIHNFPEGLATFLAALNDPGLGVAIAIAVALHNIPEGISVSVPIYYATGNRRKAFFYSLLSGLAEPVGALIAWFLIVLFLGGPSSIIPPQLMGVMFGGVAGIMVYISLDELIPTSHAYGRGHDSILGLLGGMAVMALSLLLMK